MGLPRRELNEGCQYLRSISVGGGWLFKARVVAWQQDYEQHMTNEEAEDELQRPPPASCLCHQHTPPPPSPTPRKSQPDGGRRESLPHHSPHPPC